ncbi:MAG: MopE-related protein [Polyangiales bacterium]
MQRASILAIVAALALPLGCGRTDEGANGVGAGTGSGGDNRGGNNHSPDATSNSGDAGGGGDMDAGAPGGPNVYGPDGAVIGTALPDGAVVGPDGAQIGTLLADGAVVVLDGAVVGGLTPGGGGGGVGGDTDAGGLVVDVSFNPDTGGSSDDVPIFTPPSGSTVINGEICEDAFDNDGDGNVNEDCPCNVGARMQCYPGAPAEAGGTSCTYGSMTCGRDGLWGACEGAGAPQMEVCDGLDNNCDGEVDEGCGCTTEGERRSCYAGPTGSAGVGVCRAGAQVCERVDGRLTWGLCNDMIVPNFEMCSNGIDDDCDGDVDEGCTCTLGATRDCYTGPGGTVGTGMCRSGFQRCVERGDGGSVWSTCLQVSTPEPEVCDGADNDCNGEIDEGCGCTPGQTRTCYNGPPGTSGRGVCRPGTMVCGNDARWGRCTGEVQPSTDICDGLDNNCDGRADEACRCQRGETMVFSLRTPNAMPFCGIQEGDGRSIMEQTCAPARCPDGQVSAEMAPGDFRCVPPPPDCLATRFPRYVRPGEWRCDRGCEVTIRYGGAFGDRVVCAPRPDLQCTGCFQAFRVETETWQCTTRCAGGMAGLRFGSTNVCVPCPNPPGMIIRPRD